MIPEVTRSVATEIPRDRMRSRSSFLVTALAMRRASPATLQKMLVFPGSLRSHALRLGNGSLLSPSAKPSCSFREWSQPCLVTRQHNRLWLGTQMKQVRSVCVSGRAPILHKRPRGGPFTVMLQEPQTKSTSCQTVWSRRRPRRRGRTVLLLGDPRCAGARNTA